MAGRKREPNEQRVSEVIDFLALLPGDDAVLARACDGKWYPAECSGRQIGGRWYVLIQGNAGDDWDDALGKVWPKPVEVPDR